MEINYRSRENNPVYNVVYQRWYNMIQRCYNPKNPYYKHYGEKGVIVCEKWKDLNGFIDDFDKIKGFNLELILEGKLFLDKDTRELDNKEYNLDKCEFVTVEISNKMKQNQQKMFVAISPNGDVYESYNQSDFAKSHSLSQNKISQCLKGTQKSHKQWTFCYK